MGANGSYPWILAHKLVILPSVTGVTWQVNGVTKTAEAQPAMTTGQTSVVTAIANEGYKIEGDDDWVFDY